MERNLIIDIKILDEYNISIDELLDLYKISFNKFYYSSDTEMNNLQSKGFISISIYEDYQFQSELRRRGKELLELLTTSDNALTIKNNYVKKSSRSITQDVDANLQEYRLKWKNVKAGVMGAPKSCRDKLIRWFKENPSYTMEDVLKAADVYLKTENNSKYIQRADYFIFKKEGKEESSRLSAYIDEIDDFKEDGWTSKLN